MLEEVTVYVDYLSNTKYGVFIDDPLKEKPDHVLPTVSASLTFISKNYGIETHVELSHCAEIIFKIENQLDMNMDLS
jgi:hypothetical protein